MNFRVSKFVILCGLVCAAAPNFPAHAQYADVYKERIRSATDPAALPESVFGERYDFYKGNLSFYQEDVRIVGTGPDILIGRTFSIAEWPGLPGFAAWQLTIPRLVIKTAGPLWGSGGNVAGYTYDRCSGFPGAPPGSINTVPTRNWWNGVQYVDSAGTSRDVLRRSAENMLAPGGATGNYPAVTADGMQFSCLPATENGAPGEGFLGLAPDGTRYWFNWLVKGKQVDSASNMAPNGKEYSVSIYKAAMMVTRVEDRHGNYISYAYSGDKLQSITGGDGRHVQLLWNLSGNIASVATGGRQWQYEYDNLGLARAIQPDGSAYTFNLAGLEYASTTGIQVDCSTNVSPAAITEGWPDGQGTQVATMTSPSGMVAKYLVGPRLHARSKVPYSCIDNPGEAPHAYISPYYASLALLSRRYFGPGVDKTWTYSYSAAAASWATCATCAGLATTEVTAPDGAVTRYLHSADWGANEGKLIELQIGVSAAGALRIQRYAYAPSTGMPYPDSLGRVWDPLGMANTLPSTTLTPASKISIIEGSTEFRRTVELFDDRARPITVAESSGPVP